MPYPTSWDGRTAYARCAPSKPARLELQVLKVFPDRIYDLLIVSSRPCVVAVHYDGRRTLPCSGQQGVCWFDHALGDVREQTWLTVWDWQNRNHRLLALTPVAAWSCPEIRDPAIGLRGARLKVGRKGNQLTSPMWANVEVSPVIAVRDRIPQEIDLLELLRKMWRAPLTHNLDGARKPFTSPVPDWDRGADAGEVPPADPEPVSNTRSEARKIKELMAKNGLGGKS